MKTRNIKLIVAVSIFVLQAWTLNASVTIVDGTGFTNTFETGNTRLHLKGAALLKYLVFIDAYAGALYLPKGSDGSQALDDIIKHLELEYRVAISADDFAKATLKKIKGSVSSEVFKQLLPKIEALNSLYRNVKPGDRYALAYIPGAGTQLIYNTIPLGTVEGAQFARAVFGIWIGDNPIDKEFRNKLLGKEK